ncbi:ferritin-like domain-containing protein [Russula compacta]|nr:ferritin-like domain-containing protein [Russula compacta]
MRYLPSLLAAVLVPLSVSALPVRRDIDPDDLVLQFALTLEQLETQFYGQMLSIFSSSDFANAGFVSGDVAIEQFETIKSQESTHVSIIQGLITDMPPLACSFDFSSVLTDVETALTTARTIEDVGVGAYLGATVLIQDPDSLLDATSIMTVEARHQTILNIFNDGMAIPRPFDIPLSPQEVLSIAGVFISECDLESDLGIQANAPLSLANTGAITVGTSLQFELPALRVDSSTSGLFCQLLTSGQTFAAPFPIDKCVVPLGVNGPVAIFITSDSQPLNGDLIARSNQSVVAGPVITFVDAHTDLIDALVLNLFPTNGGTIGSMSIIQNIHLPPPSPCYPCRGAYPKAKMSRP